MDLPPRFSRRLAAQQVFRQQFRSSVVQPVDFTSEETSCFGSEEFRPAPLHGNDPHQVFTRIVTVALTLAFCCSLLVHAGVQVRVIIAAQPAV